MQICKIDAIQQAEGKTVSDTLADCWSWRWTSSWWSTWMLTETYIEDKL